MERRALSAAIGCVAAIVAALSLLGLIEASLFGVVLALIAIRAAASALEPTGQELSRTAVSAIPLAALLALGVLRAGSVSLDAVRGANSVLGPAALTRPPLLAVATFLACVAVVTTAPRIAVTRTLASMLQVTGWLLTGLLVVTVAVGPTVDGIRTLVTWTSTSVVVFAAMAYSRALTERPRALAAAVAVAAVSVGMAVFA